MMINAVDYPQFDCPSSNYCCQYLPGERDAQNAKAQAAYDGQQAAAKAAAATATQTQAAVAAPASAQHAAKSFSCLAFVDGDMDDNDYGGECEPNAAACASGVYISKYVNFRHDCGVDGQVAAAPPCGRVDSEAQSISG
jgi:hypothetical protein